MAVKEVKGTLLKTMREARKAERRAARKRERLDRERLLSLQLPTANRKRITDFLLYTSLLYGREKIGKSQWAGTWPDVIFFATEPGTTNLDIREFNSDDGGVRNWKIMRRGVELLENHPKDARSVVVDTAEDAFEHCMDFVCDKLGIEHPGVDEQGRNDWGKSWRAIRKEFKSVLHRIKQTGRGLLLISHAQERKIKSRSGDEYDIIEPTLTGQAAKIILPMMDNIFFADYMRADDGSTVRAVVSEGDETVRAGHRGGDFPRFFAPPKENGYEAFQASFQGSDEYALDPRSLLPSKRTSAAGREFLRTASREESKRRKAARKGVIAVR